MGQRAIWSGIISFGLVSIPVKLHLATETKGISFHQIHKKCKTRIQEKRWCPKCEKLVDWDDIEKGFEYEKGKYVVVTKEDFASLPLPSKDAIAIQSFVKLAEIDPIYFDRSYYLETDKKTMRPFLLFMRALAQKEMVAIGSFAIRSKERLCCLRPVGGTLLLETLLYPDEIKIDLGTQMPKTKVSTEEMDMVSKLMKMMERPFKPETFKDHYREALEEVIESKLKGRKIKEPKHKAPEGKVLDLMSALKRSVEEAEHRKPRDQKGTVTKLERTPRKKRRKVG